MYLQLMGSFLPYQGLMVVLYMSHFVALSCRLRDVFTVPASFDSQPNRAKDNITAGQMTSPSRGYHCGDDIRVGHIIVNTAPRQRMVYQATTFQVYVTLSPSMAAEQILAPCLHSVPGRWAKQRQRIQRMDPAVQEAWQTHMPAPHWCV